MVLADHLKNMFWVQDFPLGARSFPRTRLANKKNNLRIGVFVRKIDKERHGSRREKR